MTYRLTPSLNDGKNDPPPRDVVEEDLIDAIEDEMHNDYGQPFGVGFTLKIERIA